MRNLFIYAAYMLAGMVLGLGMGGVILVSLRLIGVPI